ncbi:MAG: 30S ribosomal protein S8 [archaeon]
MNDPLAAALSCVLNAERLGKKECRIKPVSNTIKRVLGILKDNSYIGELKEEKDGKGNYITVNLLGNINRCNTIKPRYAVQKDNFEKYEMRYLPAKDFGLLLVSTSQGIMTHIEIKKKGIGGRLLAFCY